MPNIKEASVFLGEISVEAGSAQPQEAESRVLCSAFELGGGTRAGFIPDSCWWKGQ